MPWLRHRQPLKYRFGSGKLIVKVFKAVALFLDNFGGSALDEARVSQLLLLGRDEAGELFDFLFVPRDLGRHVDQLGQIDVHLDAA